MMRFSPITLGQQLKAVAVSDFVLTETSHPPSFFIPRHAHEHTSLSFVLKGSFVETVNRRAAPCAPFNLVIKPGGEVHSDRYGLGGARCLIIEVKPEGLAHVRSTSKVLDRSSVVQSNSTATLLAMRLYREFQVMDMASPLAMEGLILEMLAEVSRPSKRSCRGAARPRWLQRAVDLIHTEFSSEGLMLSKVAAEAGVHPSHLARVFRQFYHSTVGDYVRKLRVELAARELASSDRSLAEIAMLAGFYDQSHLTTAFRLHMQTTPAAFRRAFGPRKGATKRARSSKTS